MDIQHSIPAIGENPGSIGWLAQKLEDTELTVSETKSGVTALFADFPDEDGLTFVARPYTSISDQMAGDHAGFDRTTKGDDTFKVVPVSTKSQDNPSADERGLFGALTPAAEDAAEDWRDSAVDAFIEQWTRDGEDEKPVTVEMSR